MQASTPIVLLREPEHRLELVNPLSRIAGKLDVVGKTLREVMPEDESYGVLPTASRSQGIVIVL